MPGNPIFKRDLKVALAWSDTTTANPVGSPPTGSLSGSPNVDLNLHVYKKTAPGEPLIVAGFAQSKDNTYEIVDIEVTPGETYLIKIQASGIEPSDWTWYGIAWNVSN